MLFWPPLLPMVEVDDEDEEEEGEGDKFIDDDVSVLVTFSPPRTAFTRLLITPNTPRPRPRPPPPPPTTSSLLLPVE